MGSSFSTRRSKDPLFWGHVGAATVHGVSSITSGILLRNSDGRKFSLDMRGFGKDLWSVDGDQVRWLVPVFPALSTLNHLVSAIDWKGYQKALSGPDHGPVAWRWAEYSVSASAMIWIIAQLSGTTEVPTLTLLALQNVALQFIGFMIEKSGDPGYSWSATGYILFLSIWIPIVWQFLTSVDFAKDENGVDLDVPKLVYAIVFLELSLFATFGIVSTWSRSRLGKARKTNKSKDFTKFIRRREGLYIGLSLVSKTLLTWLAYGGALMAGQDD